MRVVEEEEKNSLSRSLKCRENTMQSKLYALYCQKQQKYLKKFFLFLSNLPITSVYCLLTCKKRKPRENHIHTITYIYTLY